MTMSAFPVLVGAFLYAVACFSSTTFPSVNGFSVNRLVVPSRQHIISPSVSSKHAQQLHKQQSFDRPCLQQTPSSPSSSSALNLMIAEATDASSSSAFLFNTDVWVFLAGVFPFAWATVEFWRRVMVGESFGTGSDQVIIGMDDSPSDSRGRRVLGRGALITAYVLFTISFGTIGIVLYSVISSGSAPDVLPEVSQSPLLDTIVM